MHCSNRVRLLYEFYFGWRKNLYYFGHLKEKCPANSERKIVLSDRKMQDSLTKRYEKIKFFPLKMRFYVQGIVKGEERIPHS